MRFLLDTHTFLWYVLDDPQLGPAAKMAIADPSSEVLASYWEIAIKISIGKYSLTVPYESFWRHGIEDNEFTIPPIEIQHTEALLTMPFHH